MAAQQLGRMHEFEPEHVKEFKAKLQVREDVKPKFFKPRSVPADEELDRLERSEVLEKIPSSDWAAPIVTVPNKDRKVS